MGGARTQQIQSEAVGFNKFQQIAKKLKHFSSNQRVGSSNLSGRATDIQKTHSVPTEIIEKKGIQFRSR